MPALHDLVRTGNITQLVELLEGGANPNITNENGDTPLHLVARTVDINPQETNKKLQMAEKLISFGANVDALNNYGWSPLRKALIARNTRMMEFLLQNNAQVNLGDQYGCTTLYHATFLSCFSLSEEELSKDLQLVKILLKFNADANIRNTNNISPLQIAVFNQNLPMVQELLKHNASVNLLGFEDRSVLLETLQHHDINVDIVWELLRHECPLNTPNTYGQTPMNVYMNKLWTCSFSELEKAHYVFKLLLFCNYTFTSAEEVDIQRLSIETNCQLSQLVEDCRSEILRMQDDYVEPNYSFHDAALHVFYRRSVPHLNDTVLDKLINSDFYIYSDVIVSSFDSRYLSHRFAEICSDAENAGKNILIYDVLRMLSSYLTHLDMLNMMIAWS